MKLAQRIGEIASVYSLETQDVVELLREATSESIELRKGEDIGAYYKDNNIVFIVKENINPLLRLDYTSGNEAARTIDITKNRNLYKNILAKFQQKLEEGSARTSLIKILELKKHGNGICKGEIVRLTRNGFFVKTAYGSAFCRNNQQVLKEAEIGLYKHEKVLDFYIKDASISEGKLRINVSRTAEELTNFIIQENFSTEAVLFNVKRKCGVYVRIYHDARITPSDEMTKKLRYLFGGENIIYRAVL